MSTTTALVSAARRPPPPRGPAPPIPPLPQDVGASDELTLRQAKLGEGGGWCSIGVEVGPACIVRRKCQQRDEFSGNRGQWVHTSGAVWVVVGWRWCRTGWVRRRTDRNGDVLVRVFRHQAKLSFSRVITQLWPFCATSKLAYSGCRTCPRGRGHDGLGWTCAPSHRSLAVVFGYILLPHMHR